MATTNKFQPNSNEYIEVVNGTTNDFLIQAVTGKIYVAWGTSVPAADTLGYILNPGEGVLRNGLTGKVYARGVTGNTRVVVTEE